MKTKRMAVIGTGLALTLALGTGFAAAQTTASDGGQPPAATAPQTGDHDAMHQQMRDQMPAEQQARCDAHHAQMGNGNGAMMGGGGTGHGSGGMGHGSDSMGTTTG